MCTTTRAKKVVVGLTLVALIVQTINSVCWFHYHIQIVDDIYVVMFNMVVPVTVLIINMIVVREVRRRASSDADSNLGLQHHQSTSSNSAVPTVMLVITSLIYVLLNIAWCISLLVHWYTGAFYQYYTIAHALSRFIYTYNFYVYLMTGKQFRADLLTLLCCCCRSCSSSSAVANVTVAISDQAETVV